jgi:serine/threonine protein kinase
LHGKVAKVADFSMARGIHEVDTAMTSYVSTRWYRAPEILLMSKTYSSPVDLFAIGCIYSEIHTGLPLFPGFDELDQLRKIFGAVGTPMAQGWQEGVELLNKGYRVIQWPAQWTTLGEITSMKGEAIDLLTGLLRLDPSKRLTADQALAHSVFASHKQAPINTTTSTPAVTKKLPVAATISPTTNIPFLPLYY